MPDKVLRRSGDGLACFHHHTNPTFRRQIPGNIGFEHNIANPESSNKPVAKLFERFALGHCIVPMAE
jgi:hypothetical protein